MSKSAYNLQLFKVDIFVLTHSRSDINPYVLILVVFRRIYGTRGRYSIGVLEVGHVRIAFELQ